MPQPSVRGAWLTVYGFRPPAAPGPASPSGTVDLNQPLGRLQSGSGAPRLAPQSDGSGRRGRRPRERAENSNRWGVAPALALGLGTPTRAFVAYEHQYEHNLPDYGLPSTAVAGATRRPRRRPAQASFFSPGVNPATYPTASRRLRLRARHQRRAEPRDDRARLRPRREAGQPDPRGRDGSRQVEVHLPQRIGHRRAGRAKAALTHGIFRDAQRDPLEPDEDLTAGAVRDRPAPAHPHRRPGAQPRDRGQSCLGRRAARRSRIRTYLVDIHHPDNLPGALHAELRSASAPARSTEYPHRYLRGLYAFDTIKRGPVLGADRRAPPGALRRSMS